MTKTTDAANHEADAGGEDADHVCGFHSAQWPSTQDVLEFHDVSASYLSALATIDVDELHGYLKLMPKHSLSQVMAALGLRSAKHVNRGMAQALLTRMKNRSAVGSLVDLTCVTVGLMFRHTPHDPDAWSAFAAGTGPGPAITRHGLARSGDFFTVVGYLRWGPSTPTIDRLGLAHAIDRCGNPVMSLWFLSAYDPEAGAAYDLLRQEYPMIPAGPGRRFEDFAASDQPLLVSELDDDPEPDATAETTPKAAPEATSEAAVRIEAARPADQVDPTPSPVLSAPSDSTQGDADEVEDVEGSDRHEFDAAQPSVEELINALDWDEAFALSLEVRDALEQQAAPSLETLRDLEEFTSRALTAAGLLSGLTGNPVPARSADLAAALGLLAAQSRDTEVLHRVAGVTGPQQFDETLAHVRALATHELQATADPTLRGGLIALHDLAVACSARKSGAEADFLTLGTLDSSARAGLPMNVHPVILAANLGDLTFPEAKTTSAAASATFDTAAATEPVDTAIDHDTADDTTEATTPTPAAEADLGADSGQAPADDHASTDHATTPQITPPPGPDSRPNTGPDAGTPLDEDVAAAPEESAAPSDRTGDDVPTAAAEPEASEDHVPDEESNDDTDGNTDEDDLEALLLADLAIAPAPLRVESVSPVAAPAPSAAGAEAEAEAAHQAHTSTRGGSGGPEGPAHRPRSATPDTMPPADRGDPGDLFARRDHAEQWLLEADLLRNGRFGLAAHLHGSPAHRAARELAAYQQHLTHPAGQLAAAFATSASRITREALGDDRAGQLLAWAAAARVAVVAPASGASGVLADLAPCFTDTPALAAVGDAFALAAQSGAIALPELAGALSTLDDAEVKAAAASEAARTALNDAPRRKIKYTPANGVYLAWMDPTGPLGSLLAVASSDDPTKTTQTLASVAKLRGGSEGVIDSTFSSQRKRSRKDKIVGGARTTLITLWEEALDIAAEWASATQTAREAAGRLREGNSRTSRPLETLRRSLADVRDDALAELDELSATPDPSAGSTDTDDVADYDLARATLDAGAAAAVTAMLTAAFATADGRPPVGEEPAPAWPLNSDLLATALRLDATSLAPLPDQDAPDTPGAREDRTDAGDTGNDSGPSGARRTLIAHITDVARRPFDAETAYQVRTDRLEHQLTAALVDNLTRLAPEEAALLRARRDNDVAEATAALLRRRDDVSASVRSHQREATVPMEVATTMLATAEAIRPIGRYDFAAAHRRLDDIEADLAAHHAQQVIAARDQITAAAGENMAVAEHAELLTSMIDQGQVAGALEYLEQLTASGMLPEPRREGHHFDRFFPAVVDHAAASPNLLGDLVEVLGGNETTRAVVDLETLAEVTLSEQPEGARRVARHALGAWQTMAINRRADVDTVLKAVLSLAGFEYKSRGEIGKPTQGRQWIRLTGVTAIGHALAPALGSQMSRGGSSLRVLVVHKATSPATVIEWLREERVEETVLVLHLAGSYTPAERRSLADAARGRPRPVTIVIDPAVMAYLAVQPQADRATLAALTLPFTAESPYQDRAGRTAPEMFYGRSRERESVMSLEGPSFVSGGRQLGKSALLWSAKELFDDGDHRRAVMTEIRVVGADADPEQLWPRLASVLHDADILPAPEPGATADSESVPAAIRTWLDADTDRRLLILLDEADLFLDADAADNRFVNIDAIKRLMETTGRRVKFVLAGLHRVVRFESLANQPLAHLGKQITIGPLKAQAAYDLVTRPLNALGYRFADDHTGPARVLAFTNNVPSLLQLFGQALMRRLTSRPVAGGPPTLITDDDITAVIEDTDLAEQFRNKYLLTLRLDPRYLVIVYAVAHNALVEEADLGMTLPEIEDACRSWWPEGFAEVTVDHLRGLVTECCDLGVLAHDQGRYRMRTQTMLRLLGSLETVEETLVGASTNLLLPVGNDTASYRAPMPHTSHRSPLTSRQLSEILSARGTCFIVAGSAGTGVSWVPSALTDLEQQGASRGMRVQRANPNVTAEQIRGAGSRVTRPTLYVIDGRGCTSRRVRELVTVCAEVSSEHPDIVAVIAADQTSAPVWAASPALIELTRVDAGGLRLWCDEVSAPFHTAEDQSVLHQASGGWPRLLTTAFDEASGDSAEARLSTLATELAKVTRARALVAEAGLEPGDAEVTTPASPPAGSGSSGGAPVTEAPWVLWAYFAAIAALIGSDVSAGASMAELADAVAEEKVTTPHGATVTLAEVAEYVGFSATEDVLIALRACGALAIGANGDVAAEPVLLQACALAGLVASS